MGKDADRENLTLVRLPRRLFRDFRENGSLFTILKIALAHMKPDEWEKYDVLNPANKSSMFDVLAEMDRRMQEVGVCLSPCALLALSRKNTNIIFHITTEWNDEVSYYILLRHFIDSASH